VDIVMVLPNLPPRLRPIIAALREHRHPGSIPFDRADPHAPRNLLLRRPPSAIKAAAMTSTICPLSSCVRFLREPKGTRDRLCRIAARYPTSKRARLLTAS